MSPPRGETQHSSRRSCSTWVTPYVRASAWNPLVTGSKEAVHLARIGEALVRVHVGAHLYFDDSH